MKNTFILSLLLFVFGFANAQGPTTTKYEFFVDITKISNDLVQVELKAPEITSDKIIYNIPKIIPGTYSVYDFGQYVMDLEAFDKEGRPLSVLPINKNQWEISNAKTLDKITYWVDDTWDAEGVEEFVFEPGGTNIEEDENVIFNNHGFFGYFEGMKNFVYEINITRPEDFYGSTGLSNIKTKGNTDTYVVQNYMDVVDSPIMYNKPDTTILKIGNTDVLISLFSKGGSVTTSEIAEDIKGILEAQKNYLGGKLPVDKYAFLIYLYTGQSGSGGSGALEHSYSSLYYLPEMPAKQLSGFLVDVAAHEFFHIVTPLNIHSEEIGNFDYINPKMSKHLWLYEGVTEYFANHVQVFENLITEQDYLDVLLGKLNGKDHYNDILPFTEMSEGCLDEHKHEYGNVYQKGALIGMCLDINIREAKKGSMGLRDLMHQLSQEYGPTKSFKDEELFEKISWITYPELIDFFDNYVAGNKKLPLEEIFKKVGITYQQNVTVKEFTLGNVSLGYNQEAEKLEVMGTKDLNEVGKKLGYKVKDQLISLNGQKLTYSNYKTILNKLKEGDKMEVLVLRTNKGKTKEVKLKTKAKKVGVTKRHHLVFDENATEQQLELRRNWLNTTK